MGHDLANGQSDNRHKHAKVGQLVIIVEKSKNKRKVDFEFLNFKTFTNVLNFGVYYPY
jgi:hypothetical protein